MQVFCGITTDRSAAASAGQETVCAVALVAAGGGLIATDTFGDDPRGWVRFAGMLARQNAERSPVSIAVDGDAVIMPQFAAASGHLVVHAENRAANAKDALDGAINLGRSLATGELDTSRPVTAPAETIGLRPILDTVTVASRARNDAAEALTCLLRAVFPAALAAWDDPSEANAVAILSRLPQPGALQSISTEELAADLATVADPGQVAAMAGALTEAIREIGGGDDPAVAPSVSAAAEAVAAWDRALEGLVGLLQAKRPRGETAQRKRPVAEESQPESRPRRFSAEAEQTVRLPGELPSRESLRALDPASQQHPIVQLPKREVPSAPESRSERRRRREAAEAESAPAFEPVIAPEPDRPPWRPPQEEFADIAGLAGDDDGLFIFSQAKSAWFKRPEAEEPEPQEWTFPADEGWQKAASVTESPRLDEPTPSGLPRRKPQANLLPGSVVDNEHPVDEPIERDAELLAQNTAGYFRGWGRARGRGMNAGARRTTERMAAR